MAPDEFFDPAKPQVFPTNFPGEFFYQIATSDNITTPGCNGGPTGRALMSPRRGGRVHQRRPAAGRADDLRPDPDHRPRWTVPGHGLQLRQPVRHDHADDQRSNGGIARNRGTEDVGCTPVAPDTCDFTIALQSRVLASFLRWDPAVAPAAPAGYIGDGVTLHKVVGAPYSPDGITPANYFQINDAAGVAGRQDQRVQRHRQAAGSARGRPGQGRPGRGADRQHVADPAMTAEEHRDQPADHHTLGRDRHGRGATSPRPRPPATAPPWRPARAVRSSSASARPPPATGAPVWSSTTPG